MSRPQLVTMLDIIDAIAAAIGVQAADTNARTKIRGMVNDYYMNDVVPLKNWTWLEKSVKLVHIIPFEAGTVIVTEGSTTITFSTPPTGLGSFANRKFSVSESDMVYDIASHTANSTTAILSSAFQEETNATANFKVWRDRVDLPTDLKEIISVTHPFESKPLDPVGIQKLRLFEASKPKLEGFPAIYNPTDFFDPSTGDDESESDRYRQLRLYPAITETPVTLSVDYTQKATGLEDDLDEPSMPLEDRAVLYYGAGAMAWSIISRNEEMSDKWQMKADRKLARMAGDGDKGGDRPQIAAASGYVNMIRNSGLKRRRRARSWLSD